jgi:hypothetical protein
LAGLLNGTKKEKTRFEKQRQVGGKLIVELTGEELGFEGCIPFLI